MQCAILILQFLCLANITNIFEEQSAGGTIGSSIGSSLANATSDVLWRTMKEPTGNFSVGPSHLDFRRVVVGRTASNILIITNGTSDPIEINSIAVEGSQFKLKSSPPSPLIVPPNTEVLIGIEFLPTLKGNHGSQVRISFQTNKPGKNQQIKITLKGKGVTT